MGWKDTSAAVLRLLAGDTLGVLSLTIGDSLLARVDLVAAQTVERMSMWEMLMSYF